MITNMILGIGLAMDAFSVSIANGLNETRMKLSKMTWMSFVFGLFQGLMPLIGWYFVTTLTNVFVFFKPWIPWIALILLVYIGGKMIYESLTETSHESSSNLLMQAIATSIDALSVGFTIASYGFMEAMLASLTIGSITFILCLMGGYLGKKVGAKISNQAGILGGSLLILIGLKIFITSLM